jgi:hypothetical protein
LERDDTHDELAAEEVELEEWAEYCIQFGGESAMRHVGAVRIQHGERREQSHSNNLYGIGYRK